MGNCEVQQVERCDFLLPHNLIKTCTCGVLCVCVSSGVQGGKYPRDSTMKARTFVVRDFVIGTSNALVATVSVEGTDVTVLRFFVTHIVLIPRNLML